MQKYGTVKKTKIIKYIFFVCNVCNVHTSTLENNLFSLKYTKEYEILLKSVGKKTPKILGKVHQKNGKLSTFF